MLFCCIGAGLLLKMVAIVVGFFLLLHLLPFWRSLSPRMFGSWTVLVIGAGREYPLAASDPYPQQIAQCVGFLIALLVRCLC